MEKKISLLTAILININIIIGVAFFLGAGGILKKSGSLSFVSWIAWGLIVLPIVLILAKFTKIYPLAGGLYIYAHKILGSFWGFVSGWGLFIGTVAGNAIIIYAFGQGISNLGFKPILTKIGLTDFSFTIFLIILFTFLNFANINFLEKTNQIFAIFKVIPLFFVLISTLFLFNINNVTTTPTNLAGFFGSIPFIIFAYMGFECCCAIAHQIKDGQKNASKAILISFGIIMLIYAILQFCMLSIFGINTINPFLEILPKLTTNNSLIFFGNSIIQIAILSSFLAGFYATFYANNWVLYAIAKEKCLPFSKTLTKLNTYKMPWICMTAQAILIITFLFITQNKYYLITMSVFGVVIAYFLSTIAFIFMFFKKKNLKNIILGILGSLSGICFLYICFDELAQAGFRYILPFFVILGIGLILKRFSKK